MPAPDIPHDGMQLCPRPFTTFQGTKIWGVVSDVIARQCFSATSAAPGSV
jgi:hypothetical protein